MNSQEQQTRCCSAAGHIGVTSTSWCGQVAYGLTLMTALMRKVPLECKNPLLGSWSCDSGISWEKPQSTASAVKPCCEAAASSCIIGSIQDQDQSMHLSPPMTRNLAADRTALLQRLRFGFWFSTTNSK